MWEMLGTEKDTEWDSKFHGSRGAFQSLSHLLYLPQPDSFHVLQCVVFSSFSTLHLFTWWSYRISRLFISLICRQFPNLSLQPRPSPQLQNSPFQLHIQQLLQIFNRFLKIVSNVSTPPDSFTSIETCPPTSFSMSVTGKAILPL